MPQHNPKCNYIDCNAVTNLKYCSGCKYVLYCSVICQKKGWTEHKLLCKKIKIDELNSKEIMKETKSSTDSIDTLINSIEDYVFNRARDTIAFENRHVEAIVYSMDDRLPVIMTKVKDTEYWDANVPSSIPELIKSKSVCKRIFIIPYNKNMHTISGIFCNCSECDD